MFYLILILLSVFFLLIPLNPLVRRSVVCSLTTLMVIFFYKPYIENYLKNLHFQYVSINALDTKNFFSEGTEVWINDTLSINHSVFPLTEFISDGIWESQDNFIFYKNYNKIENQTDYLTLRLPEKSEIEISFQTNKWRGKVEIMSDGHFEVVDTYSDSNLSGTLCYSFETPYVDNNPYLEMVLCLLAIIIFTILFSLFEQEEQKNIMSTSRDISIDILKLISAFSIVVIHFIGVIYFYQYNLNSNIWIISLIINSITRFATPCFLISSGIFLMRKQYDRKQLCKKITIMCSQLLVWNLIYIIYEMVVWDMEINFFKDVLTLPFQGREGHLWYMYLLIKLYILSPVLVPLYNTLEKKRLIYFIMITLIIPGTIDFVTCLLMLEVTEIFSWNNNAGLPEIGLIFLGKLLYDEYSNKKINRLLCIVVSCIAVLSIIAANYYLSFVGGGANDTFSLHIRIPAVLYGISVFMLSYSYKDKVALLSENTKSIIVRLSSLSLGTYFVHILVQRILGNDIKIGNVPVFINYIDIFNNSITSVILSCFLYFIASLGVSYILSHFRYLKKLVC